MIKVDSEQAAKDIVSSISRALDQIGLMYRVFYRKKDAKSILKKLSEKDKYIKGQSKIQDIIGVRVVLYFFDDIEVVHNIVNSIYNERSKDQSISVLHVSNFEPVRYNIVYDLPDSLHFSNTYNYSLNNYFDSKGLKFSGDSEITLSSLIDDTFELQIRTVLSEGWHEVEHDLRYKFKEDWINSEREARLLNGVYASLETNEWLMKRVFDELAYRHYKDKNWCSMFRQLLRIKITNFEVEKDIIAIFDKNQDLAKEFFRVDRNALLMKMNFINFNSPLKLETVIYLINIIFVKNADVDKMTPKIFKSEIERALERDTG